MSEDKRCQNGTRCGDDVKPLCDCLWITQEPTQPARVPQPSATENHLFHRKGGGGGQIDTLSGREGPPRSQMALFAQNCRSDPVRRLGVSGGRPRGKRPSRSWWGGSRRGGETMWPTHLLGGGAASGYRLRRPDRRLKHRLPRFLPENASLLSAPTHKVEPQRRRARRR